MVGARRKARQLALQALFEMDSAGHKAEETIPYLLKQESLSEENIEFIHETVSGVIEHKTKIDEYIKRFAPSWPVSQIAVVDKNILRLALFEILIDNKVPVKVAINEAVELAKKFGSSNSSKFVNGVLGAVSTFARK